MGRAQQRSEDEVPPPLKPKQNCQLRAAATLECRDYNPDQNQAATCAPPPGTGVTPNNRDGRHRAARARPLGRIAPGSPMQVTASLGVSGGSPEAPRGPESAVFEPVLPGDVQDGSITI